MKFPIDMVALNEDQVVIKIHHNVPPGEVHIPFTGAKYVIELNGGFCKKFQVEEGDKVFEDDIEHRETIGKHSLVEIEKRAQEGTDYGGVDYSTIQVYYDKLLKELQNYRDARRRHIINTGFEDLDKFDIHSPEPEPIAKN